jgi:hypothetical protein
MLGVVLTEQGLGKAAELQQRLEIRSGRGGIEFAKREFRRRFASKAQE